MEASKLYGLLELLRADPAYQSPSHFIVFDDQWPCWVRVKTQSQLEAFKAARFHNR
jgi:hypothetical protein